MELLVINHCYHRNVHQRRIIFVKLSYNWTSPAIVIAVSENKCNWEICVTDINSCYAVCIKMSINVIWGAQCCCFITFMELVNCAEGFQSWWCRSIIVIWFVGCNISWYVSSSYSRNCYNSQQALKSTTTYYLTICPAVLSNLVAENFFAKLRYFIWC